MSKSIKYISQGKQFLDIPGTPIAYWIKSCGIDAFKGGTISKYADAKQGFKTGNNDRFLRFWFEISDEKLFLGLNKNSKKWFPCNKGGEYRKWYGNFEYVVNWQNNGFEIINYKDGNGKQLSRPQNISYNFKTALTWSTLSSSSASFRFSPDTLMFESKGSELFPNCILMKTLLVRFQY